MCRDCLGEVWGDFDHEGLVDLGRLDALVVDDEEVVEAGFQLSLGEGRHLFDVLADEGLDGLDGDAARGFFLGAGPGRQHVVVGDQEIGSQALLDIFPAPFVDLIHRRHGDVEGGVSDHEIAGAPELLVGGAVALVRDVEVGEAEGALVPGFSPLPERLSARW